jgi:hypothetical protein
MKAIIIASALVLGGCTKPEAAHLASCVQDAAASADRHLLVVASTTSGSITNLGGYVTLGKCQEATTSLAQGLPPGLVGKVSITCVPQREDL